MLKGLRVVLKGLLVFELAVLSGSLVGCFSWLVRAHGVCDGRFPQGGMHC